MILDIITTLETTDPFITVELYGRKGRIAWVTTVNRLAFASLGGEFLPILNSRRVETCSETCHLLLD